MHPTLQSLPVLWDSGKHGGDNPTSRAGSLPTKTASGPMASIARGIIRPTLSGRRGSWARHQGELGLGPGHKNPTLGLPLPQLP